MYSNTLSMEWRIPGASFGPFSPGDGSGLADGHDPDDLELYQVTPAADPRHEQAQIVALHELEAAAEAGLYPAVEIAQSVGHHPPALLCSLIYRRRATRTEMLDHHEQH